MADTTTPSATISTEDPRKRVLRQLTGTSFLTLEHVGYFALVVLMPVLIFCASTTALQLWSSGGDGGSLTPLMYAIEPIMAWVDTTMAVSLSAALLVLTPLMYVLRRRIAAEYGKRPGYTSRVAYKLPVYSALAVLAVLCLGACIQMLYVFLNSLVNIGVKGADIGEMYTTQFVPALLALVIFGLAAWYVAWVAKGKDLSKVFGAAVSLVAAVATIALLVTTLTLNHDTKIVNPIEPYSIDQPYSRY